MPKDFSRRAQTMLKGLKKKKPPKIELDEPVSGQIVCGACEHVRKPTDSCPEWQCPGCGKAYSKVNAIHDGPVYTKAELHQKNREYLEEKSRSSLYSDGETHPAAAGAAIGFVTFMKGLGSACAAANPVVQVAGLAILVGSLIWGLSYFWP